MTNVTLDALKQKQKQKKTNKCSQACRASKSIIIEEYQVKLNKVALNLQTVRL